MSRLVDVYPYFRDQQAVHFLLLKRAKEVKYGGQWRMVGGKVESDEKAMEAALRELEEETGLLPKTFWVIPSINQFYDPQKDTVHQIPAFAAEVDPKRSIALNHEHVDHRWISVHEIEDYIHWPEQQRLMNLASTIISQNKILKEWII